MTVRVQTEDFDVGVELAKLRLASSAIGGIVSFVGLVRDLNEGQLVASMCLEHYPGMTEKSLQAIIEQAKMRWNIVDAVIVHRVGELKPNDQIVLVIVTSAHRKEAFAACEFMMDYLKTEAPFWKKEVTSKGSYWVEAKSTDDDARDRWKI